MHADRNKLNRTIKQYFSKENNLVSEGCSNNTKDKMLLSVNLLLKSTQFAFKY